MPRVKDFIFGPGPCHYTACITIYKHTYAEISMVLAGYSITSIVQNVYWLLKNLILLVFGPQSIITR